MSLFGHQMFKAAIISLATITGAASITVVTADVAHAAGKKNDKKSNKGGSKKSKSNAKSNRSSKNKGGGGAIARELGNLNAANANPAALRNAAPNSMAGKIYTYQQSKLAIISAENARNHSYTELYRLQNMSAAQIAAQFPNGDHAAAISAAGIRYNADTTIYSNAINTANQSLSALTNGQQLSAQAMAELNAILGL